MATMSKHKHDWCHVCGHREKDLVDVWYPPNAEHALRDDADETEYIRICENCIRQMLITVE